MLARCDSDRLTLDRGIVDLGSLVRETAGLMRSLAFQKDVSVSVSVTEPLKVLGDEAKLNRLLLSILDNALKHTPTHGSVNVRAFGDQEWARVEISDTGGGIADSDLPHIFDRFYRGKASERQGGFGLGLTIARSIAEAHQGKIEVASPPSGGTTFTVLLPLSRDEKTLISF